VAFLLEGTGNLPEELLGLERGEELSVFLDCVEVSIALPQNDLVLGLLRSFFSLAAVDADILVLAATSWVCLLVTLSLLGKLLSMLCLVFLINKALALCEFKLNLLKGGSRAGQPGV
jgi:hypothetical protein